MGISVSRLQPLAIQDDLFSHDGMSKEKVTAVIDKLQERFGRRAIMKGFSWQTVQSQKKEKE